MEQKADVVPGDANGDGEVNVADIVEIVNYILEKPSGKFDEDAADINGDGEVNVADVVAMVSIIMSAQNNAARRMGGIVEESTDKDWLTLKELSGRKMALCLDNQGYYVASQFDVRLSDGMTLEGITLNGGRMNGHQIAYTQTGENLYKVIVFSMSNETFVGNSGELIEFRLEGDGSISIENIVFMTAGHKEKHFPPLSNTTTGIHDSKLIIDGSSSVYDLQGRRVMNGGKKGVYIKNGKKQVVR